MEPFGVKVSMIEPGNFLSGTNMLNEKAIKEASDQMWAGMSDEVRASYGEAYFRQRVEIMRGYMNTGLSDLSPVIGSYTDGLLDVFPQKRYNPMNVYFKVRTFVARHLPEVFYDTIYISHAKRDN